MPVLLITDALSAVRARTGVTSAVLGDTPLTAIIEQCGGKYYDALIAADEDRYVTSETFVITSGNTFDLASLNSDVYRIRLLEIQDGGDWRRVRRVGLREKDAFAAIAPLVWSDIRYRILGSYVYLYPESGANGTYRIWYIPAFGTVAVDGLEAGANWWECVICDACAIVCAIQEVDPSVWIALRDDSRRMMLAGAHRRDGAGPERMTMARTMRVDDDG